MATATGTRTSKDMATGTRTSRGVASATGTRTSRGIATGTCTSTDMAMGTRASTGTGSGTRTSTTLVWSTIVGSAGLQSLRLALHEIPWVEVPRRYRCQDCRLTRATPVQCWWAEYMQSTCRGGPWMAAKPRIG